MPANAAARSCCRHTPSSASASGSSPASGPPQRRAGRRRNARPPSADLTLRTGSAALAWQVAPRAAGIACGARFALLDTLSGRSTLAWPRHCRRNLDRLGQHVVTVRPSECRWLRRSPARTRLAGGKGRLRSRAGGISRLRAVNPDRAVHLWSVSDHGSSIQIADPRVPQHVGAGAGTRRAPGLDACRIDVVSTGVDRVTARRSAYTRKSHSPRTLQSHPTGICELHHAVASMSDPETSATEVVSELLARRHRRYRGLAREPPISSGLQAGRRPGLPHRAGYVPAAPTSSSRVEQGGIGLAIAEHLANRVGCPPRPGCPHATSSFRAVGGDHRGPRPTRGWATVSRASSGCGSAARPLEIVCADVSQAAMTCGARSARRPRVSVPSTALSTPPACRARASCSSRPPSPSVCVFAPNSLGPPEVLAECMDLAPRTGLPCALLLCHIGKWRRSRPGRLLRRQRVSGFLRGRGNKRGEGVPAAVDLPGVSGSGMPGSEGLEGLPPKCAHEL